MAVPKDTENVTPHDAEPLMLLAAEATTAHEGQAYSAEPETYVQCGDVIDDIAFFTDGFMDWVFAQKRKIAS